MFIPPPNSDQPRNARQPASTSPDWKDLRAYVNGLKAAGAPPEEIAEKLSQLDLEPSVVAALNAELYSPPVKKGKSRKAGRPANNAQNHARQLERVFIEARQKAGKRNMLIGGLICPAGIMVTIFSMAATQEGGGRFIIAWGAILFGGIQFFRGLTQVNQGNRS